MRNDLSSGLWPPSSGLAEQEQPLPSPRERGEGARRADEGRVKREGRANGDQRERGFTVAELITVVAVIAILASMALPVISFGIRRQKEIDLRYRLRRITEAIDRYHDLRLAAAPNNIKKPPDLGQDTYPKDLDELTKPIELNNGKFIRLLRERDLIDPMTGKPEWNTLASGDAPDATSGSTENVFEVHSKSTVLALDGKTHYNEW